MPHRPPFDIKRPLVAARDFIFAGKDFKPGDPFPADGFNPRLIRRQYEARAVNHTDEQQADEISRVVMTGPKGGRYTITAPWLEKDEVVRGKLPAEERFKEIVEAGAPLGWIEGGSDVTLTGGEGGWYEISAPWLEEPEKVQGREAAEARQLEIHQAGAPEDAAETGSEGAQGGDTDQDGEITPPATEGADAASGGETEANEGEEAGEKDDDPPADA